MPASSLVQMNKFIIICTVPFLLGRCSSLIEILNTSNDVLCFEGITKTFSTVKPSCMLEAPSIDVLRDDYVMGIGNLRWVQDQVVMHGVSKKQGLLVPASTDAAATRIKIKHKLFEVSVFFISKASS